jgi:hypothetical protein
MNQTYTVVKLEYPYVRDIPQTSPEIAERELLNRALELLRNVCGESYAGKDEHRIFKGDKTEQLNELPLICTLKTMEIENIYYWLVYPDTFGVFFCNETGEPFCQTYGHVIMWVIEYLEEVSPTEWAKNPLPLNRSFRIQGLGEFISPADQARFDISPARYPHFDPAMWGLKWQPVTSEIEVLEFDM